jgi:hypothetical protein
MDTLDTPTSYCASNSCLFSGLIIISIVFTDVCHKHCESRSWISIGILIVSANVRGTELVELLDFAQYRTLARKLRM